MPPTFKKEYFIYIFFVFCALLFALENKNLEQKISSLREYQQNLSWKLENFEKRFWRNCGLIWKKLTPSLSWGSPLCGGAWKFVDITSWKYDILLCFLLIWDDLDCSNQSISRCAAGPKRCSLVGAPANYELSVAGVFQNKVQNVVLKLTNSNEKYEIEWPSRSQ